MISKLKAILNNLDEHTLEVVKKSSASMVVKVLGMAAGLFVSIMLGRILGPGGVGIISLAEKIAIVVMTLALFGLPNVVVKEVAIAYENKDWVQVNSVMDTALKINIVAVVIVIGLMLFAIPYLVEFVFKKPELKTPLTIAVVASGVQVFSRIFASGVNGFRKIWQSNLVEQGLSIWFVAIGLGLVYVLEIYTIDVILVAWLYAIGRVIVLVSISIYWINLRVKTNRIFNDLKRKIVQPAKSMLIISVITIISANTGELFLGFFEKVSDVGLYSVASRMAALLNVFLLVANSTISPKIAAMYSKKEYGSLELMLQKTNRILLIISIMFFIVFVLFGKKILLLWGDEFVDSYVVLIILLFAQVVNVSTGSSGMVLIMTGYEILYKRLSVFIFFLNIAFSYILVKTYGIIGVSVSTSLIIVLDNILKLFFVIKKTNIYPVNIKFRK